jgi:hypothetical protein
LRISAGVPPNREISSCIVVTLLRDQGRVRLIPASGSYVAG